MGNCEIPERLYVMVLEANRGTGLLWARIGVLAMVPMAGWFSA